MKPWFFIHFAQQLVHSDSQLSFEWVIDPQTQVFLQDHVFSGQCLVPAAISAELCIEAALHFAKVTPFHGAESKQTQVTLKQFKINRPVSLDIDQQLRLYVVVTRLPDHAYQITLRRHLYHSSGKLLRQHVLVASAIVAFDARHRCAPVPVQLTATPCNTEANAFDFGQQPYYAVLNPSHGTLFQSLTGRFTLAHNKQWLRSEFNLSDKEQHFCDQFNLPFACSPLAIDSVLQACVLSCVQIESEQHATFFSKLPIGLEEVHFYQAMMFHHTYQCTLAVLDVTAQTQTLRAWVTNDQGTLVAYYGQITLHRAPNETRQACRFERDYLQYLVPIPPSDNHQQNSHHTQLLTQEARC